MLSQSDQRRDVTLPIQHRAIQSRRALIRAAAQAFIEKGVPASGMVDISRRARLSKGALYFHFASKEELTLAVREEALGILRELEADLARSLQPVRCAARDFAIALLSRVDSDVVLRAGLQMRPETAPGLEDAGLEKRWYALFLEKATADRRTGPMSAEQTADARRTAQLLTTLVTGLLHLGHDDRAWWCKDQVTDIWSQLLPAPDTARTGETRCADRPADAPATAAPQAPAASLHGPRRPAPVHSDPDRTNPARDEAGPAGSRTPRTPAG
ncbi:helix-turn-helix domain-containing protein [Streptomyces sp. NPDC003077]|uniref:helix-turn-helix domain-containing protein n=1 Tax=Streptomyces sp. NPDC003077 TaxID=3154443 RepID=UPI0033A54E31